MTALRIFAVKARSAAFIFCWSAVASPGLRSRLLTAVLSGFGLSSVDCPWTRPAEDKPSNRANAAVRFAAMAKQKEEAGATRSLGDLTTPGQMTRDGRKPAAGKRSSALYAGF